MNLPITIGTPEEREYIDDQIDKYNTQQVPFAQSPQCIHIDYVIKDKEHIVGGITAILYGWKCLYINVLWIDENYRYKGLGRNLLQKVENEAKKLGSHLSHLDTFDFQAKDFYIKNGYEVFGELKDCPPGHSRYYLKKKLI